MSARHYPYTGGNTGTPWFDATPAWLNDILLEQTPGRDHANAAFRDARRTPEYRAWREAVFARDGFACQQCGDNRGGNLHAHHIKPYAEHPEMRLDVTNGLTLCIDCHERIHLKPIPPRRVRRKKHVIPTQQQEFIWA